MLEPLALTCILVPVSSAASPSTYLVALDSRAAEHGYDKAAKELARLHATDVVEFDGSFEALVTLLLARKPAQLALVIEPAAIDANLPRRLVPLLARFDDDPFVDCAWGIITGATAADALALVENGARAMQRGAPSKSFAFSANPLLETCELSGPARREGAEGRALEHTQLSLTGADPGWRDTLARERKRVEGCALVEWGPIGDAQGLWLFAPRRDRTWSYDAAKVGDDPSDERPRATPELLLGGVSLGGAVVIGVSSHCGVTLRALVARDVAATFGRSEVTRFHAIAPEQSFALTAIARGAAAYLAPLSTCHASRASIESWRIRAGGASLGEVLRLGYDDLIYGGGGLVPDLAALVEGTAPPSEPEVLTGIVQRVLFGDPALVVWPAALPTPHRVASEWDAKHERLKLDLAWDPLTDDPFLWDGWRARGDGPITDRAFARVALGTLPPGTIDVAIASAQWCGKPSSELAQAKIETWLERDPRGAPFLHVHARWPRLKPPVVDEAHLFEAEKPRALRFVFDVRWKAPDDARKH